MVAFPYARMATVMRRRTVQAWVTAAVAICLLTVGITAFAQVRGDRHPNLAAAQNFIERALGALTAAQRANEFDMAGHAANAKQLLEEAYQQVNLAARGANSNRN